jgi:hypothetical protein
MAKKRKRNVSGHRINGILVQAGVKGVSSNGPASNILKAKGCFGSDLPKNYMVPVPYVVAGKKKTKSMKQIYAAVPRKDHVPDKEGKKLRRRLRRMKMTISAAYKPTKRIRRVIWPSEQIQSPRYWHNGTVKEN